jgi:hypothetical protein
MDISLIQRLIVELDSLSNRVWELAKISENTATRLGVLQKLLFIIISGMVGLTWITFSK